jgi:hypothetical protein
LSENEALMGCKSVILVKSSVEEVSYLYLFYSSLMFFLFIQILLNYIDVLIHYNGQQNNP